MHKNSGNKSWEKQFIGVSKVAFLPSETHQSKLEQKQTITTSEINWGVQKFKIFIFFKQ